MEFPRVRRTRSKRSKTTQNQVGGAPAWVSPTPSTYFTSALWTPKLTMPNAENIVKLLPDPNFIKFTTQYSPEYYTAWLDAIKYQDQIYCAGLEIIIEEIKNCNFFLLFFFTIKEYINFNEQEKKTARTGSE
jgi:hypothetical protein